jgi:hypothetical protein
MIPHLIPTGGQIAFTVCDKDRFSRDDSLGQCRIDLAKLPNICSKTQTLTLPLEVIKEVPTRAPYDTRRRLGSVESKQEAAGRPAKLDKATMEVTGELDVEVVPLPLSRSAAMQVEYYTKKKKWTTYWMVLAPVANASADAAGDDDAVGAAASNSPWASSGAVMHMLGSQLEFEQRVELGDGAVTGVEVTPGEGPVPTTIEISLETGGPIKLKTTEDEKMVTHFVKAIKWAAGKKGGGK